MGQRTGAMVSFNLTASYPERVDKLVLVSCPAWTKAEGQVVYEGFMQPRHEHGVLQVQSFERLAAGEPYVDRMWAEKEAEVVRERGGWCAATQRANTSFNMADTERADRIKAPTLIIYGEYDVLRRKDRLHANIPGSTLKMFPDCGMPNYQAPEALCQGGNILPAGLICSTHQANTPLLFSLNPHSGPVVVCFSRYSTDASGRNHRCTGQNSPGGSREWLSRLPPF